MRVSHYGPGTQDPMMHFLRLLPLVVFLAILSSTFAEAQFRQIPPALNDWRDWVLWNNTDREGIQPFNNANERWCQWINETRIEANTTGATFEIDAVVLSKPEWITLPGNDTHWPRNVTIADGAAVPVLSREGGPAVRLWPGRHTIRGELVWQSMPSRLNIPKSSAVIQLSVRGERIPASEMDKEGRIFLDTEDSLIGQSSNFLEVHIQSILEDGLPMWFRTKILLSVSGEMREESLGAVLPEGWSATGIESDLPATLDNDGNLRVLVHAGTHTISITAYRNDAALELKFPKGATPASDRNFVAIRPDPQIRMIEVIEGTMIETSQLPFSFESVWASNPVYLWKTDTALRLAELDRGPGDAESAPLASQRQLWLDENGEGFFFRDSSSASKYLHRRLNATVSTKLDSVRHRYGLMLITAHPNTGAHGIGISTPDFGVQSTGRYESSARIPALTWDSPVEGLELVVHIPPGWGLAGVSGADHVHGGWWDAWRMVDLFAVLLTGLFAWRILGALPASLVVITAALTFHEAGGLRHEWLVLLLPVGLLAMTNAVKLQLALTAWKWLAVAALTILAVPFCLQQLKVAAFPQTQNLEPSPSQHSISTSPPPMRGTGAIENILKNSELSKIDFRNAPLEEVVATLTDRSKPFTTDGRGIAFRLGERVPTPSETKITLSLNNVPLGEALRYAASLSQLNVRIDSDGVSLLPITGASYGPVTRRFQVPRGLFRSESDTKSLLAGNGVTFPPGSAFEYQPQLRIMTVQNTQENIDLIDVLLNTSTGEGRSWDRLAELDFAPETRVQTGPGIPNWNWRKIQLLWYGKLSGDEEVRFWWIPPWGTRLLGILQAASVLALLGWLAFSRRKPRYIGQSTGAGIIISLILIGSSPSASAQFPDTEMLDLLRERLLEKSDAFPRAAEIASADIRVTGDVIEMTLEVHAAARTAIPLPGKGEAWSPEFIRLDDEALTNSRRHQNYIWVVVPEGISQVTSRGRLQDDEPLRMESLLAPKHVTVQAQGWTVTGIGPEGLPLEDIVLTRDVVLEERVSQITDLTSAVTVTRTITLGSQWIVETVVDFQGTLPWINMRFPLLPGERLLAPYDEYFTEEEGFISAADRWDGSLKPSPEITLTAPETNEWVERWQLHSLEDWYPEHVAGLKPTWQIRSGALYWEWYPRAGESTTFQIRRPGAVVGNSMRIHQVEQTFTHDLRQVEDQLKLNVESSLPQEFSIEIPADSSIRSVRRNGEMIPQIEISNIVIPLNRGENQIGVQWTSEPKSSWLTQTHPVTLSAASANIHTTLHFPENRWLLWSWGPTRGPSVGLGAVIVLAVAIGFVLARWLPSPLGPVSWALLGLGFAVGQFWWAGLAVIAAVAIAVWMGGPKFPASPSWLQRTSKLLCSVLAVAAIAAIGAAMISALTSPAASFLIFDSAGGNSLSWYSPISEGLLPEAGVLSAPAWLYRVLILVWALWVVALGIRLAKWFRNQTGKLRSGRNLDVAAIS